MSQDKNFGFYFEKAGLNAVQGPTSSAEEHFKEVGMAEALVREMGQNSLDAKLPGSNQPVRMEFELRRLNTGEIPGYAELRQHVIAADEATRDIDKANDRLAIAAEAARQSELYVLRIGDYGTTGLTGKEDDASSDSPLVALTRARGISAGKVGKGGSFGVGASTGALASAIRTVLWMSLPYDSDEVVFAGQSQLATHELDGVRRGPDGFFIDRSDLSRFRYLRSPDPLGSFGARVEKGTDTFILGYLAADADPHLMDIRDAFIRNFFVAIDRGLLEVKGITPDSSWTLDRHALADAVMSFPDIFPFYKALKNEPYTETVDGLGELKLFMEFDDALPKKLDTKAMRAPLMTVTSFVHHSIRAKYAAIFLCEDEPGNTKLRKLEPPAHDKWVANRAEGGAATVSKVKEFIKRGLKTQLKEEVGEEIKVADMEKLLPAGLGATGSRALDITGRPEGVGESTGESSSVHGSEDPAIAKISERKKVRIGTHRSAIGGGDEMGRAGRRGKGDGREKSKGGNEPTGVESGDGAARLVDVDFRMRSWTESHTGDIIIKLRSDEAAAGDITITALSEGGAPESFTLPISSVSLEGPDGPIELSFDGNTIKGVSIDAETLAATLRIRLSTTERFRLGVI